MMLSQREESKEESEMQGKWFYNKISLGRTEVADAEWHSTCKAETLTRLIGQDTYQ